MNGRLAKKLRREVKQSEIRAYEKSSEDFKKFVRMLPLERRIQLAWKIIRRAY